MLGERWSSTNLDSSHQKAIEKEGVCEGHEEQNHGAIYNIVSRHCQIISTHLCWTMSRWYGINNVSTMSQQCKPCLN